MRGENQSIDRDQCTNTRTMQQGKTRPNYRQTREEVQNPNNAWHSLSLPHQVFVMNTHSGTALHPLAAAAW